MMNVDENLESVTMTIDDSSKYIGCSLDNLDSNCEISSSLCTGIYYFCNCN